MGSLNLHAFLKQLLSSPSMQHAHLELKVMPEFNSLALVGFAELKEYAPLRLGEGKYSGGHARQVRDFLRSLSEGGEMLVEVRETPCLRMGKELCYEFAATHRMPSASALAAELQRLQKGGFISMHTYPVHSRKRHQWVVAGEQARVQGESVLL